MSRIEKALEKAALLRRPSREYLPVQSESSKTYGRPAPVFESVERIIDASKVDERLVAITNPHSPAAEQYKKLRARVLKATQTDNMNSLLITSAHPGEGKTVTAINFAVTLAHAIDHTVLLIDADLRRPSVHSYLGLSPKNGLSEYLQSKVQLSDVLIKTGLGKLVVLPAGQPPENPAELLASEKMKDLVKEMKYRYEDRYLVFDSSPLLTAADIINLGGAVDGIIFVVQALRTSPQAAAQALALIKGSHLVGSVFNNVPSFLAANTASDYNRYYQASAGAKPQTETAGGIAGWFRKIFRQHI